MSAADVQLFVVLVKLLCVCGANVLMSAESGICGDPVQQLVRLTDLDPNAFQLK